MAKENLYFIALLPPVGISDEVTAFKIDMDVTYQSKAALKVVPHVTLKAPFKLGADEHERLVEWFRDLHPGIGSFGQSLNGFGCFNNKHSKVIFVKPELSPALSELQRNIINAFATTYPHVNMSTYEREFHPHMTIAYRDLSPENFEKAWQAYSNKEFKRYFTCNSFCLLKHNGQRWEVIAEKELDNE